MRDTTLRSALTAIELRGIGLRGEPADIVRLSWEIKRLRSIVLRAHQYQLTVHGGAGGSELVLNALRRELEGGRSWLSKARTRICSSAKAEGRVVAILIAKRAARPLYAGRRRPLVL